MAKEQRGKETSVSNNMERKDGVGQIDGRERKDSLNEVNTMLQR